MRLLSFCLTCALFFATSVTCVTAQGEKAYVLCEGAQDFYSGEVLEAPRLGVVDLSAETPEFSVLRVFEGHSFAADLVLDAAGEAIYVAAEDTVFKLDAESGDVLAEQALEGARQLLIHEDQLFVTRGDYDPLTWGSVEFDEYLVALNADDLTWNAGWQADGIAGPNWASEGLCLSGDAVYVGVNNAFAYGEEVGLIGRVDLTTGDYSEMDLGPEGLNPVHVLATGDGAVVSVNARQYDGTSLSRCESTGAVLTATVADVTAGCAAAAWHDGGVLYQVYGEAGFRKADGATLDALEGWSGNGGAVYAMASLSEDRFLLGTTDFATTGVLEMWDLSSGFQWDLPVGVAPGSIAVAGSVTSSVPALSSGPKVLVATYDLMGRAHAFGQGLRIEQWSDGTVTKKFQLTD